MKKTIKDPDKTQRKQMAILMEKKRRKITKKRKKWR